MAFGEGKIWYDGKFVEWADATVNVMAHALHYGSTIFEGMRCYSTPNGPALFRLPEHVERFFNSAKIYRMELGLSQEEYSKAIIETVRVNKLQACYVRPFAFRGEGSLGLNGLKVPTNVLVAAWEWGTYLGEAALEAGVHATMSSWTRVAPNTLPTMAKAGGTYLSSQLAKMDALLSGFDEAIMLDTNGYVSEGSGENIFFIKNGVVYTPPLASSILPGITRDSIMTICGDLGIEVKEEIILREALYLADELFFTGTAAEVTPITKIDHITIADGKRGPLTTKIQQTFFDTVNGKVPDPHGWLTFVDPVV